MRVNRRPRTRTHLGQLVGHVGHREPQVGDDAADLGDVEVLGEDPGVGTQVGADGLQHLLGALSQIAVHEDDPDPVRQPARAQRVREPAGNDGDRGRGAEALELAMQIETHHWHGLKVVGFVATPDEDDTVSAPAPLGQRLGSLDDLARLMADERIDDIIVAAPVDGWQARLVDRLGGVRRPAGSSILVLPGPWESLLGRTRYRWIRDLPLIEVVGGGSSKLAPVKRLGDLVGAAFLLLLSSPILLVAMAAVRLTSQGPIFFRQERVGRDQRRFTLVKFRTMHQGAERDGEEILADLDDPRRTSIGGFLRRTRIDEIPQLWSVLRGDMSLVGPRPERPGFVERYLREVSGYAERFAVRPGVTGLAQVNGDYHSSPANKLRYDLAYIANAGLWLDLSILLRTVKIILTSRGV